MAIISLINRKGGVGKSTISINLAAGLATRESRKPNSKPVLLIDMDDQLSATITAMGGGALTKPSCRLSRLKKITPPARWQMAMALQTP